MAHTTRKVLSLGSVTPALLAVLGLGCGQQEVARTTSLRAAVGSPTPGALFVGEGKYVWTEDTSTICQDVNPTDPPTHKCVLRGALVDITGGGSFSGAPRFARELPGGVRDMCYGPNDDLYVVLRDECFDASSPGVPGCAEEGQAGVYIVTAGGDFTGATPYAWGSNSPAGIDCTASRVLVGDDGTGEIFDATSGGDYTAAGAFATVPAPVRDVFTQSNGRIWATNDAGLYEVTGGGSGTLEVAYDAGSSSITGIAEMNGQLFVAESIHDPILETGAVWNVTGLGGGAGLSTGTIHAYGFMNYSIGLLGVGGSLYVTGHDLGGPYCPQPEELAQFGVVNEVGAPGEYDQYAFWAWPFDIGCPPVDGLAYIHYCGDGIVRPNSAEQCDDGAPSATCNADCTFSGCPTWPPPAPDTEFCSVACPCADGQGDCDSDAQCQAGLQCVTDIGAQYGMPGAYDVCIVPGSQCPTWPPPAPDTGFCTTWCPCAEGQGDCDSDAECQTPFQCVHNVGAQYGMPPDYDVCAVPTPPTCPTWPPPAPDTEFCSVACPCADGQGDCDSDAQCQAGLQCVTDIGAQYGMPGAYDVCIVPGSQCPTWPPPAPDTGFCTTWCPCAEGQGDCDSDAECQGALQCTHNVGGLYGMPPDYDVCLPPVDSIAAGGGHACALLRDTTVRCWGLNEYGKLGDGTTTNRSTPTEVLGLTGVQQIALGTAHTCALLADSTVECWGGNYSGQLGDGTTSPRSAPTPVSGLTGVQAIDAGSSHTCAVLADASMVCWGGNCHGQLGFTDATCDTGGAIGGSVTPELTPVAVPNVAGAQSMGLGQISSCALMSDFTVKCWGDNFLGVLGLGHSLHSVFPPTTLAGLAAVREVAVGQEHACAFLADGTLECWGNGLLVDGTPQTYDAPTTVTGVAGVQDIDLGWDHTCTALSDATVRCWGENGYGQLGDGTTTDNYLPTEVVGLAGAQAVALGAWFSCALLTDSSVRCWGRNKWGQLGDGTTTDSSTPTWVLW